MKRRAGYVLVFGGAVVTFAAYLFRYPAFITVNGRFVTDAFSMFDVAGLLLMVVGIVLVRRTT